MIGGTCVLRYNVWQLGPRCVVYRQMAENFAAQALYISLTDNLGNLIGGYFYSILSETCLVSVPPRTMANPIATRISLHEPVISRRLPIERGKFL